MDFAQPLFLAGGVAACGALLWLSLRLERSRRATLLRVAAARLVARLTQSVSARKRKLRLGLLLLAVAALFAALARPQAGFRWQEVQRRGIDIMLAIDTSRSMRAQDVAPDRLERAKLGILDFVEKLEGDRVGLIPFAGEAYLMCPLTLDYNAFRQSLETVDTEIVPVPGTDIANAIRVARKAMDAEANHRILVLITDGEDLEGEALEEAKRAGEEGMMIHTVGVGTPAGELVPLGAAFVRDAEGRVVKSRLDEKTLGAIATATGGVYQPLGRGGQGLEAIYREKLSLVPKEELMARRRRVPLEQFQWAAGLGALALLIEMLLGDRRSKRRLRFPRFGRGAAAAALLLSASAAHAGEGGDPRVHHNDAVAAYHDGRFDEAEAAYRQSLRSDDLALQSRAFYGLGNARYRQGEAKVETDPKQTIAAWEDALVQYEGALKLDPADEDARFNRDLVKRKLEELKRQEEKKEDQKKEDQKKEDQKKEDQKKEDQKKEDQKNQDQKGEDQKGEDQKGEDQKGQDQKGEDQKGEDQKGQDQKGQDQKGQDQKGEDQKGEDQKGQDQKGQDPKGDPKGDPKNEQEGDPKDDPKGDPKDAGSKHPDTRDGEQAEPSMGGKEEAEKPRTRLDGDGEEKQPPKAGQAPAAERTTDEKSDDEKRRGLGLMTRHQAKQLLDALSEGEGRLAFVPQHSAQNKKSKQKNRKDW